MNRILLKDRLDNGCPQIFSNFGLHGSRIGDGVDRGGMLRRNQNGIDAYGSSVFVGDRHLSFAIWTQVR